MSMNMPVEKNKTWISALCEAIDRLGENEKSTVMKRAGEECATDLMELCRKQLGTEIRSVNDLVTGWNELRNQRGLRGNWEFQGNTATGIFSECGCPLVRSGLINPHPVMCYCSRGMMETVFSHALGRPVEVQIQRSICRGANVCEVSITF